MQMDVSFILMLFLTALTGMLLLLFRETAAMGTLLAIHLGVVAAFFLMIPYGKLAHVVYRYSALVRNAIEQRRAASRPPGTATEAPTGPLPEGEGPVPSPLGGGMREPCRPGRARGASRCGPRGRGSCARVQAARAARRRAAVDRVHDLVVLGDRLSSAAGPRERGVGLRRNGEPSRGSAA